MHRGMKQNYRWQTVQSIALVIVVAVALGMLMLFVGVL